MSEWDRADFDRRISDLNRAIVRAFTIEGEVSAPPTVTAALGRAFECFDDGDLAGAQHWIGIAETRVTEQANVRRADPEGWLRRVSAEPVQ